MSFVPCCKCGNISIVAPLHRVLKTFVKRTNAQAQKHSMNISQISSSPFLTHQVNFSNKDDDITSGTDLDSHEHDSSNHAHNEHDYVNITENPILALAIPQNSIFIRDIDQVRFANDHNQFPEMNGQITLEDHPHDNSNVHLHQDESNQDKKISDHNNNFTVSLVIKSVFLKCSKCGTIFVINFTRRNAYLCRIAAGSARYSPNKDSIPIDDNNNSYEPQNPNNKQPTLPPRAIIRSFTSSPFLAQRQALKNKASVIRSRQMISNFVPVFVMPFICGCGNASEQSGLKGSHSHPMPSGHPGSAPTIDPRICEKRIKRSNSLGSQKPWTKIQSNNNTSDPNDNSGNNNADNDNLFTKSGENAGLTRNHHYGSDGDIFGLEWPDTDFEFMFSAKEDIPFEFNSNVFL